MVVKCVVIVKRQTYSATAELPVAEIAFVGPRRIGRYQCLRETSLDLRIAHGWLAGAAIFLLARLLWLRQRGSGRDTGTVCG